MTSEKKIDPRYAVVFGACLTQFMIIGLLFSYSLFFKTFEDEFGWSRATLSAAASIAFLMMGVLASFLGHLGDRFGPRPVLAVTGVLHGLGFALISQVGEPWHLFLIFGLFIGLGMSTHDVITLSTVARWFDKRRGMMTGVVKTGTAAGQMVLPLVAAFLIADIGWRSAALTLGLGAAFFLLIAAMLMKRPPPAGGASTGASDSAAGGLKSVLNSRVFWTLCATQFLFFPTLTTVPLHIPVHGMDLGMAKTTAAALLSTAAGASAVGRLTVGAFFDRIGGKNGYILCFTPLIISLACLLAFDTPWLLFATMAIYGFGHGGLFTIVAPTLASYFGTGAVGAIFGGVVFFGTIGGALGPVLAGWIFDVTGSYAPAFMTLGAMAVLGLLLVLSLPRLQPASVAASDPVPAASGD
ncbi:MAG: MFS transporter [Alphaproteobacteria bacterium]|nr:MFS transporter [Alphaproteobacteria bacterium]